MTRRFARLGSVALAAGLLVLTISASAASDRAADARAALGRRLFYDADLSFDGTMACATCHEQKHGFADGNRSHPGVTGEPGRRNVPGLANVARRKSLTWGDGTIRTLEAQFLVPVLGIHPVEMGMAGKEAELARRLSTNSCYRALFDAAFPAEKGAINIGTVARAVAAFQRTLVSSGAPVDSGDPLPVEAQAGHALFRRDCASCHGGRDYTDDRFHRVAPLAEGATDRGLGEITLRATDDGKFRTPSLRNVALTAPYFHDGASPTLEAAIARHEGIGLKSGEMRDVAAFLNQLTDRTFVTDSRFAYPDQPCEAR